jgi:sugar lactone lactonase YvrE
MHASISFLVFFMISAILPKTIAEAQVQKLDWPLEIVSDGHGFTEGASLGPDGRIYFSDMDKQKINRYDLDKGPESRKELASTFQKESGLIARLEIPVCGRHPGQQTLSGKAYKGQGRTAGSFCGSG